MYDADRPLMLLYLINVLQPVRPGHLRREFESFARSQGVDAESFVSGFGRILGQLKQNRLVLKRHGRFSVTSSGLQKVAAFGLARSRDRNRLFFLKKLL
jgi:hypothetical protein